MKNVKKTVGGSWITALRHLVRKTDCFFFLTCWFDSFKSVLSAERIKDDVGRVEN